MKKNILFVFLLVLLGMSGSAQNSYKLKDLRDLIEKGNVDSLLQQIDSIDQKIEMDSSTLSMVRNNIFLLRQDYSLYNKKKKKYYGYEGQNQFGTTYSIALKAKGYNIIFDESVHPWNYDNKYKEFASNTLSPVLSSSSYQLINETMYSEYLPADSLITATQTIKENFLYVSKPFIETQDGFLINNADTCKSGVVVWVCISKGSIEDENASVKLLQTFVRSEMFGSIPVYPPSNAKNVVAALYFTKSEITSERNYSLSGIVLQKDGKYMLTFPFKNFKYKKEETAISKKVGKLTEIKK